MTTYTNLKTMTARFAGRCATCQATFRAGEQIRWDGVRRITYHATADACDTAQRLDVASAAAYAASQAARPKFDLTPIRAFIQAAKDRGLRRPLLRVLDLDGRSELALGLTVKGVQPGSVSVYRNGDWIGVVRPDGEPVKLTDALAAHLLAIAAAPAAAAKAYAVLKGRCSFCSKEITDAGSVEVGYGPVCAKAWGLPHKPKGTPMPVAAPTFDVELAEIAGEGAAA